jgi:hypothetical protein
MNKKVNPTEISEKESPTDSTKIVDEEEEPFAEEIRRMRETIEHVEREFKTKPVHIKISD